MTQAEHPTSLAALRSRYGVRYRWLLLLAVMVGTSLLGGILGAILAIPFTAALRVLMFRYVWRRPEARVG